MVYCSIRIVSPEPNQKHYKTVRIASEIVVGGTLGNRLTVKLFQTERVFVT